MTLLGAYKRFCANKSTFATKDNRLNLEGLFKIVSQQYLDLPIRKTDERNPDADMLLFEYGNFDWTGEGLQFNFSVKRQVFIRGFDEPGFYGLTAYFDSKEIGQIEAYSKWCTTTKDLTDWLNGIAQTTGFKKAHMMPLKNLEFDFQQPT